MKVAVVSSSLSENSRSRLLAKSVESKFEAVEGVEVDYIDLADLNLPLCDGGAAYGDPNAQELSKRLEEVDACVIATPIYNYTINSTLKAFTELAGRQLEGKLVGFLVAAGGPMSYMAVMQYANSLMLDFRTLILPRFVYATSGDWKGDDLTDKLEERLDQFDEDFLALARKVSS